MKHLGRLLSVVMVASLFLAACAPAAAPAAEPTAAPTEVKPTPVVSLAADAVTLKGKLLICSDLPYPPQEFFDEEGNPTGSDIEIGNEIAKRLGLEVQIVNSVFDTVIAAATSGKCDIIISAQNITADRQKQVSMIPYFQAGQSFVVAKGNPNNIKSALDVCGQAVAAESGTTEVDHLDGTGDYEESGGLAKQCKDAGKEAPKSVVTQKDSDALQQLQSNKVVAYFTDAPVAAYYTIQHPDQFELAGEPLDPIAEGISVPCGAEDCTNAPLSPLGEAVKAALKSMMDDGTYGKILEKWNLSSAAIEMK